MPRSRSKWILAVVEFVKIALNSVKERMMIMEIRRTFTKNPNTQQRCERKVTHYLRSLEGRASQQAVKKMVNCVCPNSDGNPDEAKLKACYRANLFLSIQQHEGTNVNGDPWGTQSEK